MRKMLTCLLVLLFALLALGCDNGQLVFAKDARVTFALVLDDRSYTGKTVIAEVKENDEAKSSRGTVQAVLADYPNTAFQCWAQLTVLQAIHTNIGYFLHFYVDMDGNETRSTGDREGVQFFFVPPSAIWSETKYYAAELSTVP